MSQSMLDEKDLGQVSGEELVSLLERSLNQDFRGQNSEAFNCISHTKTHIPKRKGPAYRKINRYFKSRIQYKKERNRRKQILQMYYTEFRSQKYIADKLGVSVSTVKRDLAKLRGYIVRQNNRAIRQYQEKQRQQFEQRVEGLSLRERFDVLTEEMDRIRQMRTRYRGHYRVFLLDMTQPDRYGLPKLSVLPHQTYNKTLAFPYKIDIRVKATYEGRVFEASLSSMTLTETRGW